MAALALHKLFLYSVVFFWMFVAVYFLTGSGTSNVKAQDNIRDLKMLEELEKQNLQLKDIAAKMRVMEMRKIEIASPSDDRDELLQSLRQALTQCQEKSERLSQQVGHQMDKALSMDKEGENLKVNSSYPEILAAYNQVLEMRYFLDSKLNSIKSNDHLPGQIAEEIGFMIEDVKSRTSAALIEVELLKETQKNEQSRTMATLQSMVQKRIREVQNPTDCSKAKKLVCNLSKGCGFGCQLHHITYCFMIAIGTGRTFILESNNWKYAPEGWESVFLPLSETCNQYEGRVSPWKGELASFDEMVVSLPIIDSLRNRPPYLPLNIPEELSPKLMMYHGNPAVWWIGQLQKYLMRPQPWLAEVMTKFQRTIGFKHPIVGVHVRRTDKVGTEAAFHSIDEYMTHVIAWYDKEDMKRQRLGQSKITTRLVYIASDDDTVLPEAKQRYPSYKFLGDADISRSAAVSVRYTKISLTGVLNDISILSKCDFLVGTFSSQVSRVAYEIMQTLHADAAAYAQSLDDIFYFGGQGAHSQRAVYDHKARPGNNEIDIAAGDIVGIAGNHWDGYSKGINRRTNKEGLYPSYKVAEIMTVGKFPPFPKVDAQEVSERNRLD